MLKCNKVCCSDSKLKMVNQLSTELYVKSVFDIETKGNNCRKKTFAISVTKTDICIILKPMFFYTIIGNRSFEHAKACKTKKNKLFFAYPEKHFFAFVGFLSQGDNRHDIN